MKQVIEAIKKYKSFVITAHVNLEGDSLGSQLAMKDLLDRLGKKTTIVDSDAVPDHYKFLPGAEAVCNKIDKNMKFDAMMILDCPTLKRIGRVRELIGKDTPVISVDHHVSNEKFGGVNWVDSNASSAGEMVYRLFKAMNVPLTKETALYLYIAILTDTGSFNYENTSSITHEIAGELLGYGLDPAIVSEKVYERRSVSDLKFLGHVLSTIKLDKKGEVAYLEITKKLLQKTGADISKSEGFVNYARSIDKVKVAMLFREDPKIPNRVNVSFRSKGNIDVNGIASCFGGGGHVKASGCIIDGNIKEAKAKVLKKVRDILDGRDIGCR